MKGAWLRQLSGLAVFLALWEAAARHGMLNPLYMPAPSAVLRALIELFAAGTIWTHLEATFAAALGGLAAGLVIGTALAGGVTSPCRSCPCVTERP